MAAITSFAARLRRILIKGLKVGGIKATPHIERIRGTKLHRVYIVANGFAKLYGPERHDLVWRILRQSLTPDERIQISMVYTVTPDELPGKWGTG